MSLITALRRYLRLSPNSDDKKLAAPDQCDPADLARYLPAAPVIVEAGAHNGSDTLRLARQWPKGRVHAFEPVPALLAEVRRKVRDYPNVSCHPYALSHRNGTQQLHLSSGVTDSSSSLLAPDLVKQFHPTLDFKSTIDVETRTLDHWAETQGITKVDLMWLDMQGMEPAALRASPKILSTVRVLHTEVSLASVYAGSELYQDFRPWLESVGFKVAREFLPYPDMGNVLFLRKDIPL